MRTSRSGTRSWLKTNMACRVGVFKKRVGTLTASVAHELTNPLSIITATCSNLLHEVKSDNLDADMLLHYIQMINGSSGAQVTVHDKTTGTVLAGPFALDSLGVGAQRCVEYIDHGSLITPAALHTRIVDQAVGGRIQIDPAHGDDAHLGQGSKDGLDQGRFARACVSLEDENLVAVVLEEGPQAIKSGVGICPDSGNCRGPGHGKFPLRDCVLG